ncbi:hypothetical protein AB0C29_15100 [Actinoplanes sp. NPDC048791]|uniref:hypothetical protein n=1 Tax=Actinoplanes sp. NPDC048791 TaxID=3154623 RepID=UPI0034040D5C
MTDQLERELRLLFAEDADRAPVPVALTAGARQRVRQARRSRFAWGAGALVAASVAAVVGAGALIDPPPAERTAAPPLPASSAAQRTGALPDAANGSCAGGYSPREVARRAFAFDGTVTAIGPVDPDRVHAVRGYVGVTFTVNEWFSGGSGPTVTIAMSPPLGGLAAMGYGPPAYGIGTRLLVSGEHRWGGTTTADAIAWGCGFTRYYDPTTADEWRIGGPLTISAT